MAIVAAQAFSLCWYGQIILSRVRLCHRLIAACDPFPILCPLENRPEAVSAGADRPVSSAPADDYNSAFAASEQGKNGPLRSGGKAGYSR